MEATEAYRPTHTPEEIFERTTRLIRELTAVSSPSGDREGLLRAGEILARELAERGLTIRREERPDAEGRPLPVLFAEGPAASERCLLLVGHMDTVLPAAPSEVRGARLHATGAIDMKGGLATFAGALELLAAEGGSPAPDLLLAVVPDEEVAGHISMEVMRELGARARELWVLEPGEGNGEVETMVVGRRGYFHWHLRVEGRSAHAGNAYWRGRSALVAAADFCCEARGLARPGRGPMVNPGRMVAGEAGFVVDLRASADLPGSERQTNVVPDLALVDGEARFLRRGEASELAGSLAERAARVAAEHGVETSFRIGPVVQPVDPEGRGARAGRVVELAGARGWRLELERERGGISFPNFLPDPGAVPVLDGLGPVGDGMHTRGEYLELRSLDRRIRLLADLLAADASR